MDSAAKEEVHVKNPLTVLKDLLSLAGNVNQTLNQFCRSLVKPSIAQQFAILETSEQIRRVISMALWRLHHGNSRRISYQAKI